MMGPYWYGVSWGWMALGWTMVLVFWMLVIIVGIAAGARWGNAPGSAGLHDEKPAKILRRRYATGDFTKEQLESMKRDVA